MRGRFLSGHVAQRLVAENDVGRHAPIGGELIGDDLVDEMTTGIDGYGLGIDAGGLPFGEGLVGHGGGIIGFTTMALHSPETGRTGFWVMTTDAGPPDDAIDGIAPLLTAGSLKDALDLEADSGDDTPPWEEGLGGLAPAGTIRVPVLDGIEFELARERRILQPVRGYAGIVHEGDAGTDPSQVDLLSPTATYDGTPLATIGELQAALVDLVGSDLLPIGQVDTRIGLAHGFEYAVDDLSRDPLEYHLRIGSDPGWAPWPMGQLWLIDTERGLLLATAEGFERGPLLEEAVETLDRVLETIDLVDLGDA